MVYLGLYLFLSAIKSENKKIAALKIIFGGIIMIFWNGLLGRKSIFYNSNWNYLF